MRQDEALIIVLPQLGYRQPPQTRLFQCRSPQSCRDCLLQLEDALESRRFRVRVGQTIPCCNGVVELPYVFALKIDV